MDVRRLRYFARIADLGSFTRAARELGVAQPALSRSVQDLEAELAIQLFRRERNGVVLTEAGRRLRAHADRIFDYFELARLDVGGSGPAVESVVDVGMPPSLGVSIGAGVIARLSQSHPEIRIRLVEAYSGDIQDMLLSGRVDVAILNSKTLGRKEIQVEQLLEDRMYLIKRTGQCPATGAADARSLADLPLILPGRSHGLRILVDEYAAALGLRLKPAHEVDSVLIAKEMVLLGMGAAILPFPVIRREAELGLVAALPIEPPLRRSLVLAIAEARPVTRAASIYMDALRAEIADSGSAHEAFPLHHS